MGFHPAISTLYRRLTLGVCFERMPASAGAATSACARVQLSAGPMKEIGGDWLRLVTERAQLVEVLPIDDDPDERTG
jgi:hypothetical protein